MNGTYIPYKHKALIVEHLEPSGASYIIFQYGTVPLITCTTLH